MLDAQEKLEKITEAQDLVDQLRLATKEEVASALSRLKEGTPTHTLLKELQETRTITASRAMEILEKENVGKVKHGANIAYKRFGFKLEEAEDGDENDPLRLTSGNVVQAKELPGEIDEIHDKVRNRPTPASASAPAPASALLGELVDEKTGVREKNIQDLLATLTPASEAALATALAKLGAKIYRRNGVVILGPLKGKITVVRPKLPTAADFMVRDGFGRTDKPDEEEPDDAGPDDEDLAGSRDDDSGEPDPALDGGLNELTQLAIVEKRRSERADEHKKTLTRLRKKFPDSEITVTKRHLADIKQELLKLKARLSGEELEQDQEETLDNDDDDETITLPSGKPLRELLITLEELKHSFALNPDETDINEAIETVETLLLDLAKLQQPQTPEQSNLIQTTQALKIALAEIARDTLPRKTDKVPRETLMTLSKAARALMQRIGIQQIQRNLQTYLSLIDRIHKATPKGENVEENHIRILLNPTI